MSASACIKEEPPEKKTEPHDYVLMPNKEDILICYKLSRLLWSIYKFLILFL